MPTPMMTTVTCHQFSSNCSDDDFDDDFDDAHDVVGVDVGGWAVN